MVQRTLPLPTESGNDSLILVVVGCQYNFLCGHCVAINGGDRCEEWRMVDQVLLTFRRRHLRIKHNEAVGQISFTGPRSELCSEIVAKAIVSGCWSNEPAAYNSRLDQT